LELGTWNLEPGTWTIGQNSTALVTPLVRRAVVAILCRLEVVVKLFLIDVDGTLLLTGGAGIRALDRAFVDCFGIAEAMTPFDLAGMTDPMIVAQAYAHARGREPTGAEVADVLARYLVHLADEVARVVDYRLMPGVPSGLLRLQAQGHLLGLATGNLEPGARIKLARGGIDGRFRFGGYGSDSADRAELVRLAADRGRALAGRPVPDADVVVVGDTYRDVAAARANGFLAIGFDAAPHRRAALVASAPDRIVTSFDEI
jgi:phosphoglycolate phosphatase-like HAD superfamily hydrolase